MTGNARQFAIEIDREWLQAQDDMREKVAWLGLEALRRVVNRSPVDTGRFKGNWSLSIATTDNTSTQTVDPGGGATIAAGAGAVAAYAAMDGFPMIHVQNNLPYASRLEDGYSRQAPAGMVAITVADLAAIWNAQR